MSVGRKPGGYDVGEAGSDAVSCVLDWAHEKYLGVKNNGHDHSFPVNVGEKQPPIVVRRPDSECFILGR